MKRIKNKRRANWMGLKILPLSLALLGSVALAAGVGSGGASGGSSGSTGGAVGTSGSTAPGVPSSGGTSGGTNRGTSPAGGRNATGTGTASPDVTNGAGGTGSSFVNGSVEGVVQSIQKDGTTTRVQMKDSAGQTMLFTLDGNTTISENGKNTTITNVQEGDRITLQRNLQPVQ